VSGRCAAQLTLPDDHTSVVDFLQRLATSFEREVESAVERHDAGIRRAFRELATHVSRRVAEFCQGGADPLRVLEPWARAATEAWYAFVTDGIHDRLVAAPTTLGHSLSPCPDDAMTPWCVAGRTSFPTGGGPASGVELLFGSRPDWDTWSAIPYVLLHELVSHVAQGPWTGMCEKPGDTDPFAEGWMDLVAHRIHNISVAGGGPPSVPPLDDFPDHSDAADGLHSARRRRKGFGFRRRAHGMDVAQRLAALGEERFLRLSMQVNVSSASSETRKWFVWGVEEALERTKTGTPLDDGGTLAAWLAQYDSTGGGDALVDQFAALGRSAAENASRSRGLP
jgi:hypothetical protein